MSETYYLGCCKCAVSFWVGQAVTGRDGREGYLYSESAEPGAFPFLYDHLGHDLKFFAASSSDSDKFIDVVFNKTTRKFEKKE